MASGFLRRDDADTVCAAPRVDHREQAAKRIDAHRDETFFIGNIISHGECQVITKNRDRVRETDAVLVAIGPRFVRIPFIVHDPAFTCQHDHGMSICTNVHHVKVEMAGT